MTEYISPDFFFFFLYEITCKAEKIQFLIDLALIQYKVESLLSKKVFRMTETIISALSS